jgi:hypothetical protein
MPQLVAAEWPYRPLPVNGFRIEVGRANSAAALIVIYVVIFLAIKVAHFFYFPVRVVLYDTLLDIVTASAQSAFWAHHFLRNNTPVLTRRSP